jgi:hypothetical protein
VADDIAEEPDDVESLLTGEEVEDEYQRVLPPLEASSDPADLVLARLAAFV